MVDIPLDDISFNLGQAGGLHGWQSERGAYGLHGREMIGWLTHLQHTRAKNVWFVGILDEKLDDFNRKVFVPQIDGSKTGLELPGIVDQVMTLAEIKPDVAPGQPAVAEDGGVVAWKVRVRVTFSVQDALQNRVESAIWFLYDDGRIYLPTGSGSRKVRNVRARPAVSVLLDQRQPARHRWASAAGTAEVLEGAAAAEVNARVRERYVSEAGEATYGNLIAGYDDVTIVVTPSRWRHWTPTSLERLAREHGLPEDDLGAWFTSWDS